MSGFVVHKSECNYSIVSTFHLRDKKLSWKAKGLLTWFLTNADGFTYTIKGIVANGSDGRASVESTVKELKECGYIETEMVRDEHGSFDYVYHIYETNDRQKNIPPYTENQQKSVDLPYTDKPCTENQHLTNIYNSNYLIENNNYQNNNNSCTISSHDCDSCCDSSKENTEKLKSDFELIYKLYPKKVGKTVAFQNYKAWLKGKKIGGETIRLSNKQIWEAVKRYVDTQVDSGHDDLTYWKNFDTLMGRQLLDWVIEEGE